jgi:predicted HAD superfamily hydrolase
LWADRVDAVVIPATACGGSAILSLSGRSSVQIIAVGDNKTQMQATPEKLGIKALQVNSYLEAIGVLVAKRAGISPASLGADISSLRCLSD